MAKRVTAVSPMGDRPGRRGGVWCTAWCGQGRASPASRPRWARAGPVAVPAPQPEHAPPAETAPASQPATAADRPAADAGCPAARAPSLPARPRAVTLMEQALARWRQGKLVGARAASPTPSTPAALPAAQAAAVRARLIELADKTLFSRHASPRATPARSSTRSSPATCWSRSSGSRSCTCRAQLMLKINGIAGRRQDPGRADAQAHPRALPRHHLQEPLHHGHVPAGAAERAG